mmetsp:Transcript_65258/g.182496  ORF Transcript_65258/g.182496 Transcript_65258/m.182496 type:complete len:458 (-) Transcript_65258:87-1460(-)
MHVLQDPGVVVDNRQRVLAADTELVVPAEVLDVMAYRSDGEGRPLDLRLQLVEPLLHGLRGVRRLPLGRLGGGLGHCLDAAKLCLETDEPLVGIGRALGGDLLELLKFGLQILDVFVSDLRGLGVRDAVLSAIFGLGAQALEVASQLVDLVLHLLLVDLPKGPLHLFLQLVKVVPEVVELLRHLDRHLCRHVLFCAFRLHLSPQLVEVGSQVAELLGHLARELRRRSPGRRLLARRLQLPDPLGELGHGAAEAVERFVRGVNRLTRHNLLGGHSLARRLHLADPLGQLLQGATDVVERLVRRAGGLVREGLDVGELRHHRLHLLPQLVQLAGVLPGGCGHSLHMHGQLLQGAGLGVTPLLQHPHCLRAGPAAAAIGRLVLERCCPLAAQSRQLGRQLALVLLPQLRQLAPQGVQGRHVRHLHPLREHVHTLLLAIDLDADAGHRGCDVLDLRRQALL